MIDATRALLEQTDAEIARLALLRTSLIAFIDQGAPADPGQPAHRVVAAGEPARDPVASPLAAPERAEHRGPTQRLTQALSCQFCDRPFPTRRGLPMHESRCEKNPDRIPPWVPKAEAGEPPLQLRASRETFLCDRCRDTFPSRQALAEHRRGHPEVVPAVGPMRRAAGSLSAIGGLG